MTTPDTASAESTGTATVVPVDSSATGRAGGTTTPPGRWRFGWLLAAVWLVYLVEPLQAGLELEDRRLGALTVVVVVAFGVEYLTLWVRVRRYRWSADFVSMPRRVARLSVAGGLALASCLLVGVHGLATTPFLVVLVMTMLPLTPALVTSTVLVGSVGLATYLLPGWGLQPQLLLSLVMVSFVMFGVVQMIERNVRLAHENEYAAQLAVASERTRFARDLHDLLGHSLTLMAMKAELAGRLVTIDAERAQAEIAEVERLARDALGDVRAAVGGYRHATLAGELVGARAVLDAAGIRAELPAAVDEVPGQWRELAGWVVREGVTNVVRHSGATTCAITVDAHGVRVEDDGRGVAAEPPDAGHGLAGLRERAEAAGARLSAGRSDLGGFGLRVVW